MNASIERMALAKRLGVTLEELARGERAYEAFQESAAEINLVQIVNLIESLPLHPKVKLFLTFKIAVWLENEAVKVGPSTFN